MYSLFWHLYLQNQQIILCHAGSSILFTVVTFMCEYVATCIMYMPLSDNLARARARACVCVRARARVCVCARVCVRVYTYMYVCMYVCM